MKGKTIAIIPARGGSKRIPRKNIKLFLGQPIIKYSIEAALNSSCFDEVMVSTEDKEIAKIAEKCGAKIPFYRSEKNASDFAMTADVLEEVLLEYNKIGKIFEFACCIYPTAPFISAEKLKLGHEKLIKYKCDSVIPVVRFSYPIQRAFKVTEEKISMIWPENFNMRSQDLMPAYHDAGQFYWFKTDALYKYKRLLTDNSISLELDESEIHDIDNMTDWKIAEMKYKILHSAE
jgi:pseudaminic acid cytidylyltransferase